MTGLGPKGKHTVDEDRNPCPHEVRWFITVGVKYLIRCGTECHEGTIDNRKPNLDSSRKLAAAEAGITPSWDPECLDTLIHREYDLCDHPRIKRCGSGLRARRFRRQRLATQGSKPGLEVGLKTPMAKGHICRKYSLKVKFTSPSFQQCSSSRQQGAGRGVCRSCHQQIREGGWLAMVACKTEKASNIIFKVKFNLICDYG